MRRTWSLLTRRLLPGTMHVETSGSPKFPWNLLCPFAHAQATPAGRASLTIRETPVLPPLIQRRRLRRQYCRGSVTWLPNSLSTPRGTRYRATTQDSLPAAGQGLPDGTLTRKGSAERFPSQLLIDIPLSRASWRNERIRILRGLLMTAHQQMTRPSPTLLRFGCGQWLSRFAPIGAGIVPGTRLACSRRPGERNGRNCWVRQSRTCRRSV